MTRLILFLFLLTVPVLAAPREVLWQFELEGAYKQADGKLRSMKARPRVVTLVGSPAEITIGPGRDEPLNSGKEPGYSVACNVSEVLPGEPALLRVQVTLRVGVPGADILEQTFETLVVNGKAWHYRWARVQGMESMSLEALPSLAPAGTTFGGFDEAGKPQWKKAER